MDDFPPEMEDDLRRAMMLPATPTFPFSEDDEPDQMEDAAAADLNLNFPPPDVSGIEGEGVISEVLRVGLFPLPPLDTEAGAAAAAAVAEFPPELKNLFAYGPRAAFLPGCL